MRYFLMPEFNMKSVNNDLITFALNHTEWGYYGKGRFKIFIASPVRAIVQSILENFVNPDDLFFKIELNKVEKMGIVPPHTDFDRYVTINIPIAGDFKNSYVDFYTKSEGIPTQGMNGSSTNGAKMYPYSELDHQVNYEIPICFDTQEIHGVTNATFEDRYILTLSFREKWTFDMIEKMYKDGNLLI